MATDLKVSVKKQIDRLEKELAVATGRIAALRDEIKKHELIYDMLEGQRTVKRSRRGRPPVEPLKRGPRGAMIDWNAVLATLPDQFTLDTMSAHKAVNEKSRAYLRQVVVRWSKEGSIERTARGTYRKT